MYVSLQQLIANRKHAASDTIVGICKRDLPKNVPDGIVDAESCRGPCEEGKENGVAWEKLDAMSELLSQVRSSEWPDAR